MDGMNESPWNTRSHGKLATKEFFRWEKNERLAIRSTT